MNFVPIISLYLLLSTLLLWFLVKSSGHWVAKSVIIPCAIYFSLAIAWTLPTILGWPSQSELPEKFEFLYAVVHQPIKAFNQEGKIYLWVRGDKEYSVWFNLYKPNQKDPQAYEIPYTEPVRKKVQEAMKMVKNGIKVMGEKGDLKGKGKGKGKGQGKPGHGKPGQGKPGQNSGGNTDKADGLRFYVMPPVKQQPKS